ncbi:hypothetical protein FACS189454_02370 [Planctomycetales bacterium]|nr:hypothetical protein FACS189454_02370 [Planctomycetales bacterium]
MLNSKKSEIPEDFKSNPHRLAQKECDGNWAKKGSAAFFGYKDHPWVDAFWKLMWGYDPRICEKGYRNHPLTEEQKESNRLKSKVRCRIEHVFGEQKMRIGNEVLRSIGFARAKFWIGVRNLNSNISRYLTLKKLGRVN